VVDRMANALEELRRNILTAIHKSDSLSFWIPLQIIGFAFAELFGRSNWMDFLMRPVAHQCLLLELD